jgi:AcrR family transcriptional regulator
MAELDTDRIAAAALAIADKHGVDGFTMRAVADTLGVTPMALYHHVKDKAALAALIFESASRNHPLPPTTGAWQDDLLNMAQWMRQGVLKHPVIVQLRRAYQVWTPAMLQMTERWLSLWQESGLDLQKAVRAAAASSMAITGLVQEEMIFRTMKHPDDEMLAWLPNVRTMFKSKPDRDAEFDLVVRSLIEGLHARLTLKPIVAASLHTLKPVHPLKSAVPDLPRTQRPQPRNTAAYPRLLRKPTKRSKV